MKSLKKVKRKGLSSVSISTEVGSSLDLAANQESESKSLARKDSAKRHGVWTHRASHTSFIQLRLIMRTNE
ncbi:hypothetical protein OROHE_001723 [Orobanche hederae]